MKITAVLAMDEGRLIGKNGWLPWHIPEDLKHFNDITRGSIVVMGRATYLSLPEKYRPLPHRRNIVLTRESIPDIEHYTSIDDLMTSLERDWVDAFFLVGWATLYDQFFARWLVDIVELTIVDGNHDGDVFVSEFRDGFTLESEEIHDGFRFQKLLKNKVRAMDKMN
jgi:dihydrofolate reductase